VHLPSGARQSAGWASAALGISGFVSLVAAVVLQVQGRQDPWFGSWLFVGAGVGLVVAGAAVSIGAQMVMGSSWRVGVDFDERTELVTTGLFALSRNPIYLGMITSLGGFAMLAPSWLSLGGFVLSAAGSSVHVRLVEEPYLVKTHGDDYRRYASRVGRFLPGLGRGAVEPQRRSADGC